MHFALIDEFSSLVQIISHVPPPFAVMSPVESTVATASFEECQVTFLFTASAGRIVTPSLSVFPIESVVSDLLSLTFPTLVEIPMRLSGKFCAQMC